MRIVELEDGKLTAFSSGGEEVGSVRFKDLGEAVFIYELQTAAKGVGAYLGAEGLKRAAGKPVWLMVEIDNEEAIEFYGMAGFDLTHAVMRRGV